MEKQYVTGIILCGGKSSRMGGNPKGLLKYGNKTFAEHIAGTLADVCGTILISANSPEYHTFPYPVFEDRLKDKGPLGGIHAGLYYSATDINLFVPCDMPFTDKEILSDMIAASGKAEAIVPVINDEVYNMPFVLHKSVLPEVEAHIQRGELKLGYLFKSLSCLHVRWKTAELNPLLSVNINYQEEFDKLISS